MSKNDYKTARNVGMALFVSAGVLAVYNLLSSKKQDYTLDPVTVSAPGKVLISGGYLVLEQPNIGVVISTTSRFYTSIKLQPNQIKLPPGLISIVVHSPQFYVDYNYHLDVDKNCLVNIDENENTFVEKCILLTMLFIQEFYGKSVFKDKIRAIASSGFVDITIRADNDFYSQIKELKSRKLPLLSSSLKTLPKCLPCPKDSNGKPIIAKTGLGSSAALTTSLVGALLQWFNVVQIKLNQEDESKRIIHNLAQLVHANAQGKIGSGFDIAAAVYGTQKYVRFNPQPFVACMESSIPPEILYKSVLLKQVNISEESSNSGWNQSIESFSLPPGINLVLGDVCGGSSSTSMARKVLKWKKENEQASAVWYELKETNLNIYLGFQHLTKLSKEQVEEYKIVLSWAAIRKIHEWTEKHNNEIIQALLKLHELFSTARLLLRNMGEGAEVGIEPSPQTSLCDATQALPGILATGVPGAGGEDALFALTLSTGAREAVERMWSAWETDPKNLTRGSVVCPLVLEAEGGEKKGVMAH